MTSETTDLSNSIRPRSPVPRALWVGGGLLALAGAGLAGALITRSVQTPPAAEAVATAPAGANSTVAQNAATTTTSPKSTHPAKTNNLPPVNTASNWNAPGGTSQALACSTCGVVESVKPIQRNGQGSGLGAVAGGLLGGVVGHQAGGGNGKTALTVLGAIGGGLAGNEVEKRARAETLYEVHVRMQDGSLRVFQRAQSITVGSQVVADGSTLHLRNEDERGSSPRSIQTGMAPAGTT